MNLEETKQFIEKNEDELKKTCYSLFIQIQRCIGDIEHYQSRLKESKNYLNKFVEEAKKEIK
jgi:hypothetical protein